ncbi:hypothetical protein UPYG_G00060110 [Umbra pygmaea]|uniref:Uncharacterized protein n=1 Tax=Umbra pygmaea TaxID=75934 RepID=A0ABD0X958_UMBPY
MAIGGSMAALGVIIFVSGLIYYFSMKHRRRNLTTSTLAGSCVTIEESEMTGFLSEGSEGEVGSGRLSPLKEIGW